MRPAGHRRPAVQAAAAFFAVLLLVTVPTAYPRESYRVVITQEDKDSVVAVNRSLFSVVNYPRSYAEANPEAFERIAQLNLSGTQFRIETMIHLMEPENDNDDPFVFDWTRFRTENMFRFLPGRTDEFAGKVQEAGGIPVVLLTYNAPWLSVTGAANAPPTHNDEWAEFAAAVVQHLMNLHHEGGGPFPLYVEVWNEPGPGGPYWTGTMDEYAALFRTVADRLHNEFPGVLVGGPSLLADQGAYLMRFLELAGDVADFVTLHVYNDDPVLMARRLSRWQDYVVETTGREIGLMITETDNWRLVGGEKFRHLLIRQFELLDMARQPLGVHHFSLPHYREAPDRLFGLVRADGEVVGYNYWPYWLFSTLTGDHLRVEVERGAAANESTTSRGLRDPKPLYATASIDGSRATAILFAPAEPANVDISVTLPASWHGAAQVMLTTVTAEGPVLVSDLNLVATAGSFTTSLVCEPGLAYRLDFARHSEESSQEP